MAFHHRKLLNDSIIDALCERSPYCNIFLNPDGWCPSACWDVCVSGVCKHLIPPPPPPPPPCPPPPPSVSAPSGAGGKGPGLSLALTVCLAVLATAFFLFTCYTIYKFYTVWSSTRRRPPPQPEEDNDEDDNSFDEEGYGPVVDHPIWYIRTIGLQPSVINAITIVNYKRAEGLVEGSDCAVCLSEFEEDETLRLLPKCSHAFHIPCIDTWLRSHTNCPMCRAGIVSNAAAPVAAAQEAAADDSEEAHDVSAGTGSEEARSQRVIEINESIINIEGDDECKFDSGVRRSVSMDSLSASMISAAVSKNSDSDLALKERDAVRNNQGLLRLSSIGRCMQNAGSSSSIKRSASCSAKVFLSRHSSSSTSRNRS